MRYCWRSVCLLARSQSTTGQTILLSTLVEWDPNERVPTIAAGRSASRLQSSEPVSICRGRSVGDLFRRKRNSPIPIISGAGASRIYASCRKIKCVLNRKRASPFQCSVLLLRNHLDITRYPRLSGPIVVVLVVRLQLASAATCCCLCRQQLLFVSVSLCASNRILSLDGRWPMLDEEAGCSLLPAWPDPTGSLFADSY